MTLEREDEIRNWIRDSCGAYAERVMISELLRELDETRRLLVEVYTWQKTVRELLPEGLADRIVALGLPEPSRRFAALREIDDLYTKIARIEDEMPGG